VMTSPASPYHRQARRNLPACLVRIEHSGDRLDDEQLWWRPHGSMNSVGNILLHLCGNFRQRILPGVGGRVFLLTMTNRATLEAPPEVALTEAEVAILDRLAVDMSPPAKPAVSHYLVAIAKLGGYLARAKDPPPGNMVLWRGLTRLMDIHLGFELKDRVVGN
jgi:hypothetical protein